MHTDQWWWYDADDHPHGPYLTQLEALRGLLQHCDTAEGTTPRERSAAFLWFATGYIVALFMYWLLGVL